eukprot:4601672-Pyramimonas_sp.AAC.1
MVTLPSCITTALPTYTVTAGVIVPTVQYRFGGSGGVERRFGRGRRFGRVHWGGGGGDGRR